MGLRTGHNRLNAHLFNKVKTGRSEMCPYDTGPMISEHLLQHCPLRQNTLRKTTWAEDLPLAEKLYGDLAALRRIAAFVRGAGVSVQPS